MNARTALFTVALSGGLVLAGPVAAAWADDPVDPGTAASPTEPSAFGDPSVSAGPTEPAATEPVPFEVDDNGLDPRIYQSGLPVGAVAKHDTTTGRPAASQLPFTGAPANTLTAGGLALIALGGASVLAGRRP